MSKKYELVPYKSIGEFVFGMNRYDIQQILGKPISSGRYGFPVEDRFFDDYGFFYTMFSNKNLLEAVVFPAAVAYGGRDGADDCLCAWR